MLTCKTLYKTLISLSNLGEYREGSLGYLPFILHAKWEQDNGKEQTIDFSGNLNDVRKGLWHKYNNYDIGKLLYVTPFSLCNLPDSYKLPEIPSNAVLSYAIQTINTLDLNENNLDRENLVKAFDLYLGTMYSREQINPFKPVKISKITEYIIQKITAETESVYDPFCRDGYALSLVNAKETNGTDGNSVLSLIAKIRMDFMGRKAEIKSVSVAEHPEITPEGKLKTYPLVVSCLDDINIKNEISIISHDIYNRFTQTIHLHDNLKPIEELNSKALSDYQIGIMLGHTLAITSGRCIFFSNSSYRSPNILSCMEQDQINSFIYSDVLEAVISLTESEEDRRFRRKTSTIYIFNRNKDQKHKGKVFFLSAGINEISVDDIVRIYQNTEEVKGVSKLIPLSQLSDNPRDCLSAIRHTAAIEKQNFGSTSSLIHELRRLEKRDSSVMNDIIHVAYTLSLDTSSTPEERPRLIQRL